MKKYSSINNRNRKRGKYYFLKCKYLLRICYLQRICNAVTFISKDDLNCTRFSFYLHNSCQRQIIIVGIVEPRPVSCIFKGDDGEGIIFPIFLP